jgi:murein DD-endopeptidase MepM/ murein hydrolase activator NlpD
LNSYSRSKLDCREMSVENLQPEVASQTDFSKASRLRLAVFIRQLKILIAARADRLAVGFDQNKPLDTDALTSRFGLVPAMLRRIHSDYLAVARYAAHLTVLIIVLVSLPIGRIKLSRVIAAAPQAVTVANVLEGGRLFLMTWTQPSQSDDGYLLHAVIPRTPNTTQLDHTADVIQPRTDVVTHIVQSGDTVYDIAEKYEISPATIVWSNSELDNKPDVLSIGQELVILPVNGVYHTVAKGETLASIANKYEVEPSAIVDLQINNVESSSNLEVGQKLIVPGGQKPSAPKPAPSRTTSTTAQAAQAAKAPQPAPAPAKEDTKVTTGSGIFDWPASGIIYQRFKSGHPAIDISTHSGTPIYAADGGVVVYAGWCSVGFGNMVLIDHGNGYNTLYAHMSSIGARTGQSVDRGDQIGKVGCTGRCTGPHLHFEVIQNGVKRNPLGVLP